LILGRSGIMVGPPKESSTSAATAEHERAEGQMLMVGAVGRQESVQIFGG
jgi:hypothetical protein